MTYLNVLFKRDTSVGPVTYKAGSKRGFPEFYARSLSDADATILGEAGPADILWSADTDLFVPMGATTTEVAQIIQTVGDELEKGAPWGVGREVQLAPGLIEIGEVALSSTQSMTAPSIGASVLKFSKHKTVTADETGALIAAKDPRQKRGIPGRTTLRNITVDGNKDDANVQVGKQVHGLFGDYLVVEGETVDVPAPVIEHCLFTKCTGSGIKLRGRSQVISNRMKATDNNEWGADFEDIKDSKHFAPGLASRRGALRLKHCATPKFFGGDFFVPDDFYGYWTVLLEEQARAAFYGSEISGRLGIIGRNDTTANEWEVGGNIFDGVNFKIDKALPRSYTYTRPDASQILVSATIYIEDSDALVLNNPRLQYDDNIPEALALAATPDYFIQMASVEDALHIGHVLINGAAGLFHRRSRVGQSGGLPPLLGFTKHYASHPNLVEFDGFIPGSLELFPYNAGSGWTLPRNVVFCDPSNPTNVPKVDHPVGYLFATLATNGTLDDVNNQFTIPAAPASAPTNYRWGMRTAP